MSRDPGAGAAAAHLCAVVCRRLCFPGLHKRLTCRTGRTGLRRAGQVRQCGREGGRRRRGSTSRKETETWCADTTAPTPTENRIQLLKPICGGRTRRKSASLRRLSAFVRDLSVFPRKCAAGGRFHLGRPRLRSPSEPVGSFCLEINLL